MCSFFQRPSSRQMDTLMAARFLVKQVRGSTSHAFAALDVATGFVIGKCCKRHRATEFLDFLK